jgi:response regulator RpfG family c-di-GMP phosphodiesterase
LKLAALLHDVGLLALPREQASQEALSLESYAVVQNHSRLGGQLLEPFAFLRDAATFVAHHHERWDGNGYPYGIRGTFIPLGARILSIADAFDAIKIPQVRNRPVRDRIALRILCVSAGTQFDPDLVELLSAAWSSSPPRSRAVDLFSQSLL